MIAQYNPDLIVRGVSVGHYAFKYQSYSRFLVFRVICERYNNSVEYEASKLKKNKKAYSKIFKLIFKKFEAYRTNVLAFGPGPDSDS